MDFNNFYLRTDPDPLLYQKLEPYNFDNGLSADLVEETMIKIMNESGGIGISANQVGFTQRVIIIKPKGKTPFAMFNPEIIETNGNCIDEEGCLSFPNLYIKIERSNAVTVKYLDKNQKECIITLTGYDAKCVQHEIDHLDGITFTKKVSILKLALAIKKQRKLNGRTK
jgi:peptide deformylase